MCAFAALHVAAYAVGGGCAGCDCLPPDSVAVSPFPALVVGAQPMRFLARHALGGAVRGTRGAAGARAMLAFALFQEAAFRVGGA